MSGSWLERTGAGLRADLRTADAREIRAKLDRLLDEPVFRDRAVQIADSLARTEEVVVASRLLERLAETRAPIVRPEGCPLTLTRDLPPPWGIGQNRCN